MIEHKLATVMASASGERVSRVLRGLEHVRSFGGGIGDGDGREQRGFLFESRNILFPAYFYLNRNNAEGCQLGRFACSFPEKGTAHSNRLKQPA